MMASYNRCEVLREKKLEIKEKKQCEMICRTIKVVNSQPFVQSMIFKLLLRN